MNQDTIAAIATPPGEGAIAIIRISGSEAFSIAQKIFTGPIHTYATHTAHYGKIFDCNGETIDAVLLTIMKAPKSYTGENSVEISCHGGSLVTQKVLQRICSAGARPAQPGEFSLRAYLNGKIDLAQAEAVQMLIHAKNDLALQSAERQLDGSLSKQIAAFQDKLTEIAAILEASVDFPEEGLEFATVDELCKSLEDIYAQMKHLHATFHHGKILHAGISLCLLGVPNVGKSSLMNALLGKERAIVTEIAGTTRDLLEEDLRLGNLHFRLIDTAGIRAASEIVEQEGIRRSQKTMQEADLILLLLDASRPLSENDENLLASVPPKKTILVWNKIDLKTPPAIAWPISVAISAKKRIGMEELQEAIEKLLWENGPPSKEEVVITQLRHYTALGNAMEHCLTSFTGLKTGVSPELITSDLRTSLNELGTIIGTNVTEDILSAIFSKFCLGK
jgi:tRNA modification GTPase